MFCNKAFFSIIKTCESENSNLKKCCTPGYTSKLCAGKLKHLRVDLKPQGDHGGTNEGTTTTTNFENLGVDIVTYLQKFLANKENLPEQGVSLSLAM